MSLIKGAIGAVAGIIIILFGAAMLSCCGYGVMEPFYSGILWLGVFVFVASPLYYWGSPVYHWVADEFRSDGASVSHRKGGG